MSMLINASRFLLYGSENMGKKKVTFVSALWGSVENRVRRLVDLPPVSVQRQTLSSWAKSGIQREIMAFLGLERTTPLPAGWPVDVFECLDRWVQAKGGYMQLNDGLRVPLLKLNRKSAVTLSSFWVAYVDFEHESANWDTLKATEEALEDALARECDKQLNVRILSKPARIEIDNPKPPMVTLKSQWEPYLDGRVGAGSYFLGMESTPQGDLAVDNRLDNSNEYSGALVYSSVPNALPMSSFPRASIATYRLNGLGASKMLARRSLLLVSLAVMPTSYPAKGRRCSTSRPALYGCNLPISGMPTATITRRLSEPSSRICNANGQANKCVPYVDYLLTMIYFAILESIAQDVPSFSYPM